MKLKLERPLVVLDFETTGPNAQQDRIIQAAFLKLKPDGTRTTWQTLVNPGCLIPSDATAVHGITTEEVADAPRFEELAPKLARALDGCDVAGFGVRRFDWPLLMAEFRRAGVVFEWKPRVVDALQVFFTFNPRDLSAAVETYCGRKHVSAHDAMADVEAALEVLEAQLERHDELPREVAALEEWLNPRDPNAIDEEGKFRWQGDVAVIAFGKNAGTPLAEAEAKFLNWMLKNDFPDDAKHIAREALAGRFPVKTQEEAPRVAV